MNAIDRWFAEVQRSSRAGFYLAQNGAKLFLALLGSLLLLVTLTAPSGGLTDEVVAELGGTFFYLFVWTYGALFVFGFVIHRVSVLVVPYIRRRFDTLGGGA